MQHKKILKKTFWPHQENNYRPYFVRGRFLLMIGLFLVVTCAIADYLLRPQSSTRPTDEVSSDSLLYFTNQARSQEGKPALQKNIALQKAAVEKANDMVSKDYWAHTSPEGIKPWYWLEKNNYQYVTAGENLARGYDNVEDAIQAWLDSPEHRENMLNERFNQAGFAVAYDKERPLVVAFYALGKSTQGGETPSTNGAGFLAPSPLSARNASKGVSYVIIFALSVAALALVVSLVTHMRHTRLPKHLRQAWQRHYLVYTTIALVVFIIILGLLLRNSGIF